MTGERWAPLTAATIMVLLVGACGSEPTRQGSNPAQSVPGSGSTASAATASPTATAHSGGMGGAISSLGTSPRGPSDSPTSPGATAPVPGAFPGAGGPVPPEAIAIAGTQTEFFEVAFLQSPSGNINCDFTSGGGLGIRGGCGVHSFAETQQYGRQNDMGARWYFDIGPGVPEPRAKTDALFWDASVPIQTAAYGKAYTYLTFVCGSAENGLTCWDTRSGHGVFMNRDTYAAF